MSTVQDIINKASQDVRLQLAATNGSLGQPILIDYTNRIHQQMLRFSRWEFLRSEPQYFMTAFGQTNYWIGPSASIPAGIADTTLNLSDVDRIQKDSMRDLSNDRQLKSLGSQPIGPALNDRAGLTRPSEPKVFWQDNNDPNVLHIYPGANNENTFQPQPSPPGLSTVEGGSLLLRTYFVRVTLVDNLGGESTPSSVTTSRIIPANQLISVLTPTLYFNYSANGAHYYAYNVYAGTAEGSETLQNTSPITLGTNWVEPTSGLTTSGRGVPTTNTLQQLGGYIIQFRYYRARLVLTQLTDVSQIPDKYEDVMIQGILYLAFKLLGKAAEATASYQEFKAGLTQMIWDKNLFPDTEFIRPDSSTYVNEQILGYLPPFF